jgi:hypothetical protein
MNYGGILAGMKSQLFLVFGHCHMPYMSLLDGDVKCGHYLIKTLFMLFSLKGIISLE